MPSFVTLSSRNDKKSDTKVFDVWNYDSLEDIEVQMSNNGIFIFDPPAGAKIYEFIEFVCGVFHPDSNVIFYICDEFGVPKESFRAVKFEFNGVTLTVSPYYRDPKKLYDKWWAEEKKLLKAKKTSFF